MPANFNKIASLYDFLSRLIFRQAIKKSQINQLPFIPAGSSVLIVGGGTGWILEEIGNLHSCGLQITYVDSSSKMIALAKKRKVADNVVVFITTPIELLVLTGSYDVIITPFLFDMFTQATCNAVIEKLKSKLKNNGLWLYSDFCITLERSRWQKGLLRLMYLFFRVSCNIEATKLPEVEAQFLDYCVLEEKTYCRNFIVSKTFKSEK